MKDKSSLKPHTIGGIKRLAKEIKKADGLKHSKALNRAAEQAGFADFNDAQERLALPRAEGELR